MRSALYAQSTQWGPLLFPGAVISTPAQLAGALVLCALAGFTGTLLTRASQALTRLTTACSVAPPGLLVLTWCATVCSSGVHYGCMLLVMSFNVYVIAAVIAGHALGWVSLDCGARASVWRRSRRTAAAAAGGGREDVGKERVTEQSSQRRPCCSSAAECQCNAAGEERGAAGGAGSGGGGGCCAKGGVEQSRSECCCERGGGPAADDGTLPPHTMGWL
jgi:hypothetical protein